MALLPHALDREDVDVHVRDAGGHERTRDLKLSALPDGLDERSVLSGIGLTARQALLPPMVGKVRPDTPAWGVLAENDRITAIDGQPVRRSELPPKDAVEHYGPLAAVPAALREARYQTVQLFEMVGRVFSGRVSVQNSVAGPITIARAANAYAQQGAAWYLTILALLSLSLGILNLLPIPLLDGGHLLYYLIELVKGSPLSERAMAAGQYVGLALLAGLMGLAFYNDILNNFVR
jgi:regulator of sigma E protease